MKRFVWILLFVIVILICPILAFGPYSQIMQNLPLRLAVFGVSYPCWWACC